MRRLVVILAGLALLHASSARAATISGHVTDVTSGVPLAGVTVSAVRASATGGGGLDDPIAVDGDATTDAAGAYALALDGALPGLGQVYVFTRDGNRFNRIHATVDSSAVTPTHRDLAAPGAVTVNARANPGGIDFALESNRSDAMVLMRDGTTHLATSISRPARDGRWPAIVVRTPYNREGLFPSVPQQFVPNGYVTVVQDTRGRYASEGFYTPFQDENWGARQDGFDTVEWIAAQPWSDGHVGSYGGSALGIVQYMTAGEPPSHLDAAWAVVGAPTLYRHMTFQGGSFRAELVDNWLTAQGATYMQDQYRAHPSYDDYWAAQDLGTRLDHAVTPMVHHGGWYDIFAQGALDGFAMLQGQGAPGARWNQKLRIGPWTHGTVGLNSAGQVTYPITAFDTTAAADLVRWFDFWLKGRDNGIMDEAPVREYVMGAGGLFSKAPGNYWRTLSTWPPAATPRRYYLNAGRTLSTTPPAAAGGSDTFTYDPLDPVPTVGGPNLYLAAGPYDQTLVEQRPDVVSYTSSTLAAPLEVTGHVEAHLFASSSATDTDWTVKLVDVGVSGTPMSVTDGVLRARHRLRMDGEDLLVPGTVYEFVVDVWSTSLVFDAGHRIRVEVSSSNAPRFDPNPNTGHPFRADGQTLVATNRIYHDAAHASYVQLPVVDGASAAGCATTAQVGGLTLARAAAGGIQFRWDPLSGSACFGEYRLFGGDDPRSWAWFVRHPLLRTAATGATLDAPYVFYLVIAAGTDGANGPHWPTP